MGIASTVVFTDLTGSTSVFEALGNARATKAITQLTNWICESLQSHGGKVIKTLGDGVLTVFDDTDTAIAAVVELQRGQQRRLLQQPIAEHLPIRVGVATGEVEIVNGDCYGDAVNVASRLSDLAGPHEIWINSADFDFSRRPGGLRFRSLGVIAIRGRQEPCRVHQVEWQDADTSEYLTLAGETSPQTIGGKLDALGMEIQLRYRDLRKVFRSYDLPIDLGRVQQCQFVLTDPRVSRVHARLEWRNGRIVLVDVSSYGTWVRFRDAHREVLLRREEIVLHGQGELSLGTSFTDQNPPLVRFAVQ